MFRHHMLWRILWRPVSVLIMLTLTAPILLLSAAATANELVTAEQARDVASNWIQHITAFRGNWAGVQDASVTAVEEVYRDGRFLGYWCHVEPDGHIVVSLRRQLAPIQAFADDWDGDPACDGGLMEVIKLKIAGTHDTIERLVGPIETTPGQAIEAIAEFSYAESWQRMDEYSALPVKDDKGREDGGGKDYVEGEQLLTSNWGQSHPFNLHCPVNSVCTDSIYFGRCATGCTATAAAQIMRHWSWPPYGTEFPYDDPYHWTLMPDTLTALSPPDQIAAIANFMAEIGESCQMQYCQDDDCGSGAFHTDMRDAFEDYFHYRDDTDIVQRSNYTSVVWFDFIQENCNANQPMQYGIEGHSLVCDGWLHTTDRFYHMNYGWQNGVQPEACWDPYRTTGSNTWYALDNLPCSDPDMEDMIKDIQPDVALGPTLEYEYSPLPFPYRYVNVDTEGPLTIFYPAQLVQFLPGLRLRAAAVPGSNVKFHGQTGFATRLFTKGNLTAGVRIDNGTLEFKQGGGITFF